MNTTMLYDPHPLPVPASGLGESPFWHPEECALYWCDIPGHTLNRYDPANNVHEQWAFETHVGSCAPVLGGGLLLALRNGLWRFDPRSGRRERVHAAPYDEATQRFNDGKADAQGRFWVGTMHDAREHKGALYCLDQGRLEVRVEGAAVSNGLAWSPDGRTMYWADTRPHTVWAFDFDAQEGALSNRRVFASFPVKQPEQDLATYGGRPDGAAVDVEGCYWTAMFEGARLLRLSPAGEVLREVKLPVQCATMPCFGGADLKTLYITTARDTRPHTVWAFDFDAQEGALSNRRVFASFPVKQPEQDLATYGGRPDGAAVDVEGCYWTAMFEGARLLRLSPAGEVLREVKLPVQCATMPCFGGADLKTLYITTARDKRPPEELARQPGAGCVLQMRVDVPGLPVNFAVL